MPAVCLPHSSAEFECQISFMNSIMQMFNLNVYSSGDNHVLLSSKKRAQWNGPSHSESKGLEFKIVGSKRCVTLTKTVAGLSSRLLNRERESVSVRAPNFGLDYFVSIYTLRMCKFSALSFWLRTSKLEVLS